jgi:serine/threonine protein kinase/tetratricopeptide (TPR) repeat protein
MPQDRLPVMTETLQTPVRELTTGSTFAGRYQVIEELGHGGMGRVYKVFDTKIKEKVALKLIKPEIASDKETIERFSSEIRLARRISHRNVCRMFDIGEADGARFITMEYVHGEDLKTLIEMSGSLSLGMVLNIGKQICDGLSEAHGLEVVHRDLKPQNIMIDKRGNAKIMDFGIARSFGEKGITGSNVIIGTPDYMSPEQVEGRDIDPRSDIYSLGVILYEMATSRLPFVGSTPLGIALKQKNEPPRDPKEVNPNVPNTLRAVIMKCLEKDRSRRYQEVADVGADLRRIEIGDHQSLSERERPATTTGTSIRSIAVLPFEDMSTGRDQGPLADGIPETLIYALGGIRGLRVSARTSSFSFKGRTQDVREIGQKLGVAHLLEGSVQVSGQKLRILVRLIDISEGFPIWSQDYSMMIDDVFTIQDDIARSVVRALRIKLLGEEQEEIVKGYTSDREAYMQYLQGRFLWEKRGKDDVEKAIGLFNQAIARDPAFALAYCGLADGYAVLGDNAFIPAREAFPKAKMAALKALEIDNRLAEAHVSLAAVLDSFEFDFPAAEKRYQKAIELKPAYATAHHWYALSLACLGRYDEALKEIMRARDLDPISMQIHATVGMILIYARQYDRAIEELSQSSELFPEYLSIYEHIGFAYALKGSYDKALAALESCLVLNADKGAVAHWQAYCHACAGHKAEAQKKLAEVIEYSRQSFISPIYIARVYAALDEKEHAFSWLNRAFSENDAKLTYLGTDPSFDTLRTDSRFTSILVKVGVIRRES